MKIFYFILFLLIGGCKTWKPTVNSDRDFRYMYNTTYYNFNDCYNNYNNFWIDKIYTNYYNRYIKEIKNQIQ